MICYMSLMILIFSSRVSRGEVLVVSLGGRVGGTVSYRTAKFLTLHAATQFID